MDLLNLYLTSKYFQYNGKQCKQLDRTAMGSPVSVVVAEIILQNIEEQALGPLALATDIRWMEMRTRNSSF